MLQSRIKIHLTLNQSTIKKLKHISHELFITKGMIIDDLIEYVIKKGLTCQYTNHSRYTLTTTVNPILWASFKEYADINEYKYNYLIELAVSKRYRYYTRKIKLMKKD